MKKTSVQVRNRNSRRSKQPLKPSAPGLRAWLVTTAVVLVLGGMIIANFDDLTRYVNRPVTKVRIENQWQRVEESEVRGVLAPYLGDGFFSFEVTELQQQLEILPWVAQASVKRIWPDSVSLGLVEEVPIARWGQTEVLNQAGQKLRPASMDSVSSLPVLEGPVDSQNLVMQQYQKLSTVLFPAGLRLTTLKLSDRGSWSLVVNNSLRVVVGREQVMERISRFINFYAAQTSVPGTAIVSVDLRYDNGVAVAFEEQVLSEVAAR